MGRLQGRAMPSRISAPVSRLARRDGGVTAPRRSVNWYNSPEWKALRKLVLARDGWICQRTGAALFKGRKHPQSAVVHHKIAHRGNRALFFDPNNCEAVAKWWHDGPGQSQEKRGDIPDG